MPTETVRVSPRTRINSLPDLGIPTLPPQAIEPFLNEAIIVEEGALDATPRIVAGPDDRVLISNGDRAYARGRAGTPLVERDPRMIDTYRVFRNATPLKDPVTGGAGLRSAVPGRRRTGAQRKHAGRATRGQMVPRRSCRPPSTWCATWKRSAWATACCRSRRAR
jgi:hypothetical protein